MSDPVPIDECIAVLKQSYDSILQQLDSLRRRFEDSMAEEGVQPPLNKTQSAALHDFLTACALYQPDPDIRKKSWGTRGPSEFLESLEYTLHKLGK
jgi:hypothetical protein